MSILVDESLNAGKHVRIRAIVFAEVSWTIVRREQDPKRISINFPGELHRVIRVDDRARVYRRDLRVEDVDALDKKRPLLVEEDREPLVGSHDQLV